MVYCPLLKGRPWSRSLQEKVNNWGFSELHFIIIELHHEQWFCHRVFLSLARCASGRPLSPHLWKRASRISCKSHTEKQSIKSILIEDEEKSWALSLIILPSFFKMETPHLITSLSRFQCSGFSSEQRQNRRKNYRLENRIRIIYQYTKHVLLKGYPYL